MVDLRANVILPSIWKTYTLRFSRKPRVESCFQNGCSSSLPSSKASRRNRLDVVRTILVEVRCSWRLLSYGGRDRLSEFGLVLFGFETVVLRLGRSSRGRKSYFWCYDNFRTSTSCRRPLKILWRSSALRRAADGRWRCAELRRHQPTRTPSAGVVIWERPVAIGLG